MMIFICLLLGFHLACGLPQATNKVDGSDVVTTASVDFVASVGGSTPDTSANPAQAASVDSVVPPASVDGSKTGSESSASVVTTNSSSDVVTTASVDSVAPPASVGGSTADTSANPAPAASVDSVVPPASVDGSKTGSESFASVVTTNSSSDIVTTASVDSVAPPASVGGSTPDTSANPVAESQQLFNTATAALIEQVKSKLSGSIPFTLSDNVIKAATSDNRPTNRKKTKFRNNPSKLVLTSRSDSEVIDESERLEETEDTSNPNTKPGLAKAESSSVEVENLKKIENPYKFEQLEKSQKAAGESEQREDSKTVVDRAVDQSKPDQIDDVKTVVDKSDDLQRSSHKTKINNNNKRRNESSKKTKVERQEESSNAVLVGLTDIAVEEVVVNRKNSRFRVSIRCNIGPINVLLSTNSSEVPIASYSLSAPIRLRMGPNAARSQNVVTLQGVKARQLKVNDLKVSDGITNQAGIILNEVRQKITKVNFRQMWEEAIIASLKDENVMNLFNDASNSL